MSQSFIYKIINKLNGKTYVGLSKNPVTRFAKHINIAETLSESDNHFQAIHGAIKKYGKEQFIFEIIESCDKTIAAQREIYWIAELKTQDKKYGYNLTSGGDFPPHDEASIEKRRKKMIGRKLSTEHRQKIALANMGRVPTSETCQKISQANTGENNGMSNKTHSLETREKMSTAQSSRLHEPLSEEAKLKIKTARSLQDSKFRIAPEIKDEVIKLWESGKYTKKQIADKFALKYNSVVKIIRTNKNVYLKG